MDDVHNGKKLRDSNSKNGLNRRIFHHGQNQSDIFDSHFKSKRQRVLKI